MTGTSLSTIDRLEPVGSGLTDNPRPIPGNPRLAAGGGPSPTSPPGAWCVLTTLGVLIARLVLTAWLVLTVYRGFLEHNLLSRVGIGWERTWCVGQAPWFRAIIFLFSFFLTLEDMISTFSIMSMKKVIYPGCPLNYLNICHFTKILCHSPVVFCFKNVLQQDHANTQV